MVKTATTLLQEVRIQSWSLWGAAKKKKKKWPLEDFFYVEYFLIC